jgi:hypothetical protein
MDDPARIALVGDHPGELIGDTQPALHLHPVSFLIGSYSMAWVPSLPIDPACAGSKNAIAS